jgi:hypothetical protein
MILITDIDDVISDASWRKSLLPDWDAFHSASIDDPPFLHMIDLINAAHFASGVVIALTGRPEKWRGLTNQWMLRHHVMLSQVIMRPNNNRMSSPDLKLELLKQLDLNKLNSIIIDDRDDICTKLRGAGYNVLQCFNVR